MRLGGTKKRREGFIVVVVLCTIIMLAVEDSKNSAQALSCAETGLNIAMAALERGDAIYSNGKLRNLLAGREDVDLADGTCSITVAEESGKLNLNLLKTSEGVPDRTRIDQMLRLIDLLNRRDFEAPPISYGIVPAIIDWIDSDEETACLPFIMNANLGAESSYYAGLDRPYRARNAPLDTTEELLLIRGITPDIFERIRDYVTVKGEGKININSASKLVIESMSEKMDPAVAQMIVNRRMEKPFGDLGELRGIPGMTDPVYQAIRRAATVQSEESYYRVTSRGNAAGRECMIVAMIQRNPDTGKLDIILYKEL
jgi:type II secretory pathway component PulK